MKTSMQLNARIRNLSKETGVSHQVLLRNYMFEKFLEKLSNSKYRENFVLKGGLLIADLIGSESRATMDMDATLEQYPLEEKEILIMLQKILKTSPEDSVTFSLQRMEEIREEADYPGLRITLLAIFDATKQVLKIDISTGDVMTPGKVSHEYKKMFSEETISLKAYNLETVLAEKLETVFARSIANTRIRDFYDIYILQSLYSSRIDKSLLQQALKNTVVARGSTHILEMDLEGELVYIENDEVMQSHWKRYQNTYSYAEGITWKDTLSSAKKLVENISF